MHQFATRGGQPQPQVGHTNIRKTKNYEYPTRMGFSVVLIPKARIGIEPNPGGDGRIHVVTCWLAAYRTLSLITE